METGFSRVLYNHFIVLICHLLIFMCQIVANIKRVGDTSVFPALADMYVKLLQFDLKTYLYQSLRTEAHFAEQCELA